MNFSLYGIVALRSSALALGIAGQPKAAQALTLLASALEAGRNIDYHMAEVARLLATTGIPEDWDRVLERIEVDSARLHGE